MAQPANNNNYKVILASTSPRRRKLFELITDSYICLSPDVDESTVSGLGAQDRCRTLAEMKCRHIHEQYPDDIVVACDTVVDLDSKILEKPVSFEDAYNMIKSISGRSHKVHTGVCIMRGDLEESYVSTSSVEFYDIPDEEIKAYCKTDEPYDKAGAYGIHAWAARYIKSINGDYYSIMGLPVSSIFQCLAKKFY